MKPLLKTSYYILLITCFLALAAPTARAQVVVEAKLDRSAILVGEQAKLTTTVTATGAPRSGSSVADARNAAPANVRFRDFGYADTLMTGVEVLECSKIDTLQSEAGRLRLQRTYTITSFDSALYALPPMQVVVDGKTYLSRNRLGLKVVTVPVDTTHVDQFAPPFTVVDEPFQIVGPTSSWEAALAWTLLFLPWVFLFLVAFAATRLTGHKPLRRKVTIHPPTPPYKKAAAAMDALQPEVERAATDEANKLFFVHLTDILRLYITERYGFNAQEKTTQEIIDGLRELRTASPTEATPHSGNTGVSPVEEKEVTPVAVIDTAALEKLRTVFTTADFVKFAKHTTTDVERRLAFKTVSDILLTTRDEAQERPRPTVRYVTFSDRSLHRVRVALWVTLIASSVLLVAATGLDVYMLYDTYL